MQNVWRSVLDWQLLLALHERRHQPVPTGTLMQRLRHSRHNYICASRAQQAASHLHEPEVHGTCLVGEVWEGTLGTTLVERSCGIERHLQAKQCDTQPC